jgi:hypothetical protein
MIIKCDLLYNGQHTQTKAQLALTPLPLLPQMNSSLFLSDWRRFQEL